MRSLTNPAPVKKRILLTLWALQAIVTTTLLICSLVEAISIANEGSIIGDGSSNAPTNDQLIATVLVLLTFITLVLHSTEFGYFLFERLRASALLALELGKTAIIEPAWILVIWRLTTPLSGNSTAPLFYVLLAIAALIHPTTLIYSLHVHLSSHPTRKRKTSPGPTPATAPPPQRPALTIPTSEPSARNAPEPWQALSSFRLNQPPSRDSPSKRPSVAISPMAGPRASLASPLSSISSVLTGGGRRTTRTRELMRQSEQSDEVSPLTAGAESPPLGSTSGVLASPGGTRWWSGSSGGDEGAVRLRSPLEEKPEEEDEYERNMWAPPASTPGWV